MSNLQTELSSTDTAANPWVGIDIGGANLKVAHSLGWNRSAHFPMWQKWKTLGLSLAELLSDCPPINGVAVTMTGELADCFATRAEGVAIILEQLTSIVPAAMVKIYGVDGTWKSVTQSAREPWSVAASNWHGLARYATRLTKDRTCLMIDVGSTTTDIIPIQAGQIALEATTDSQRLQSGALVYTGVERSNVAGIVRELTLYGDACPIMNEQFATSRDVYLWLQEIADQPDNCETADNQPATRAAARHRLARVVGEDGSTLADTDIDRLASEIFVAQTAMVAKAIQRVTQTLKGSKSKTKSKAGKSSTADSKGSNALLECVVMSGHGDFLIEAALATVGWDGQRIRLTESLGTELSRCAPAYAIAVLASEECV